MEIDIKQKRRYILLKTGNRVMLALVLDSLFYVNQISILDNYWKTIN